MALFLISLVLLAQSLTQPADRSAFRLWFTFLAEAQYYLAPQERLPEIRDCSSLVRYAYRESFARRGPDWTRRNPLPAIPALPEISPRTGALFTTQDGLRYFADAQNLMRHNCFRVGHTLDRAQRGDLLFYQQSDGWHVMVYLGPSQFEPNGENYLVYHTGPVGKHPGEVRRLSVPELRNHPQPRWRPAPGNTAFRGLYRWKILEG